MFAFVGRFILEDRRPDREQAGAQVTDQRITDRIQIYRPDRTQIQINRPSVTIERPSPTSPPERVDTEEEAPSQGKYEGSISRHVQFVSV